jgi:hypothetical protein
MGGETLFKKVKLYGKFNSGEFEADFELFKEIIESNKEVFEKSVKIPLDNFLKKYSEEYLREFIPKIKFSVKLKKSNLSEVFEEFEEINFFQLIIKDNKTYIISLEKLYNEEGQVAFMKNCYDYLISEKTNDEILNEIEEFAKQPNDYFSFVSLNRTNYTIVFKETEYQKNRENGRMEFEKLFKEKYSEIIDMTDDGEVNFAPFGYVNKIIDKTINFGNMKSEHSEEINIHNYYLHLNRKFFDDNYIKNMEAKKCQNIK